MPSFRFSTDYQPRNAGHRWRKGECGNPAGRPKDIRLSPGERALARRIVVEVDGKPRRMSVHDAMMLRLAEKAAAGEIAAGRELRKAALDGAKLRYLDVEARACADALKRGLPPPGVEPLPPIELDLVDTREMTFPLSLLDGCIRRNGRWFLRPWLIQAALERRPDLRDSISQSDQTYLRNVTEGFGLGWTDEEEVAADDGDQG